MMQSVNVVESVLQLHSTLLFVLTPTS